MNTLKINERLLTAVPFVRSGSRVADIGTDHAYLPIYLLSNNIVSSAIAADINEGPIEKARENIHAFGLDEKIRTVRCDGLTGIDLSEVDDIIIFGMGGELIIKIIDEADGLASTEARKRIICQPMTHPEKLREYLYLNGYSIVGEMLSSDRGKIYQTICAEYDGMVRKSDAFTLIFGEYILRDGGELLLRLLESTAAKLERKIRGKALGGEDLSEEAELLEKIKNYIGVKK